MSTVRLLAKSERYFFDYPAISEPLSQGSILRLIKLRSEHWKNAVCVSQNAV